MDRNTLFKILSDNFGFTPTEDQSKVLQTAKV